MPRLPRKRVGNTPSDVEWNALVDFLASLMPSACADMIVNHGPHGTTYKPKTSGGASGRANFYKLDSVQDKYLTCHSWDNVTEGAEDVYVLKPYDLWTTAITMYVECGVTYTITYAAGADSLNMERTITDVTNTEREIVLPRWREDLIIGAIPASTGITAADGSEISLLMVGPFRQWGNL